MLTPGAAVRGAELRHTRLGGQERGTPGGEEERRSEGYVRTGARTQDTRKLGETWAPRVQCWPLPPLRAVAGRK